MGNVFLIKAGSSVVLRTDQKFWMVVFRSIPNEEIPELHWCNFMRKNLWSTWIYLHVKVAATMKGWGITEPFNLLSSPFSSPKGKNTVFFLFRHFFSNLSSAAK